MPTEYIGRDKAIEIICGPCAFKAACNAGVEPRCKCYIRMAQIPAADVVEVVRCRDCRYDHACLTQQFVEENSKIPFNRDEFFCPDGKRREPND